MLLKNFSSGTPSRDAQNWLIRKQLWAIEHPEAFYDGYVDYAWQKQQIEKENAEADASR